MPEGTKLIAHDVVGRCNKCFGTPGLVSGGLTFRVCVSGDTVH